MYRVKATCKNLVFTHFSFMLRGVIFLNILIDLCRFPLISPGPITHAYRLLQAGRSEDPESSPKSLKPVRNFLMQRAVWVTSAMKIQGIYKKWEKPETSPDL